MVEWEARWGASPGWNNFCDLLIDFQLASATLPLFFLYPDPVLFSP